ncbi:hypothetical protein C1I95_28710 [Micromonospora craterilacus]|uniref:Uncharacterized protein n=1 Tax=Micromonospora craterilacus TaxID=1655439 RepID=A0A2W2E801_9ACTN|nr:hypothetical protein [Micromonospora craterilacus]PZG09690.1 hypothetical protein C1I95_28710 [Micromonospora craterilacus]
MVSSFAPRGRFSRAVRAGLLVGFVLAAGMVARELTVGWLGGRWATLAFIALPAAVTAGLAPYASYRRRDALLWFIGPGLFIFVLIAWRLTLLPYRDWAPRPDEAPRARWLRDPTHAGLWYLPTEMRQNTA